MSQGLTLSCRQARLDNFDRDLGLTENQFNIAVSILDVGFVRRFSTLLTSPQLLTAGSLDTCSPSSHRT